MNKKIKIHITAKDKKYIENYCRIQIDNDDLIRVKAIICLLDNQYSCCEVINYIRDDLGISRDKIFHGEAEYIFKLPRGHYQLTNDVYFDNCYMHQYVVCKSLEIPMEQVQKYIVHHIDENKSNNDILNLWVFYNQALHQAYHQISKKDVNVDIKEFTLEYIESIANSKNADEIKKYLQILDKMEYVRENKKKLN